MDEKNGKKILIVEDEAALALALAEKLAQEGYLVLKAGDGEQGLAMALKEHPDLTLTDLKMPGMTGLEMIDELRKDSWGATAKVIILTNISDVASLEEATRHTPLHYIVKSENSLQDMLEKIHALFGDKP
jgi:CheY-like chemotaxis protein